MSLRIVRLGSERLPDEGLRIGTVRRPPRGVKKQNYSKENWYDIWLPNLSPSPETMALGKSVTTDAEWSKFARKYKAEMAKPDNVRVIQLLAALSHSTQFSVGCYCENEARCHRSLLRGLMFEHGAALES